MPRGYDIDFVAVGLVLVVRGLLGLATSGELDVRRDHIPLVFEVDLHQLLESFQECTSVGAASITL